MKWAGWAVAAILVVYRWAWTRGARKVTTNMAGRLTPGQQFRVWAEERLTPKSEVDAHIMTPRQFADRMRAVEKAQEEDGHAEHGASASTGRRKPGQYL